MKINLFILALATLLLFIRVGGGEADHDCPDVDTMAILAKYPCYEEAKRVRISAGIISNLNDTARISMAPAFKISTKRDQEFYIWYDPFFKTFGISAFIPIFQK